MISVSDDTELKTVMAVEPTNNQNLLV